MKEIEDFRLVSSNLLSSLDFGLRMSLQMFFCAPPHGIYQKKTAQISHKNCFVDSILR